MKTFKIYTLGCKVNQYDTQSIRERFLSYGFKEIYNGRQADIYVINTCSVTAKADRQSMAVIRKCSNIIPKPRILVTGCLIEKDAASLLRFKGIDFIVAKRFLPERISSFYGHTRAFLKVQEGCNNFCSYCKVPKVRGSSRSRPLSEIIQEAEQLVTNGFKEIVLSGICLGAYGEDLNPKLNLVEVIEAIEKIGGLFRLRLSSIEAGDVSGRLIDKIMHSEKLCPHLHMPIQSGDDEILKKMNRRYSCSAYLNLIMKIKNRIPGIAITTDAMVGFPGESEINFKNTLDLVKEIRPLKVHIFPYSKREGTAAADFKEEISPLIIKKRVSRLKDLADTCALNYKKQFIGKALDVLIEGRAKDNPDFWQGYADNYIKVMVQSGKNLKNQLIRVKLTKIFNSCIMAIPV